MKFHYIIAIALLWSCSDANFGGENKKAKKQVSSDDVNGAGGPDSGADSGDDGATDLDNNADFDGDGFADDLGEGGDVVGPEKATLGEGTDSAENFDNLCANAQLKTYKAPLKFPEIKDCRWGQNGNLAMVQASMQARESNKAKFGLPNRAVACSISLKSDEPTFQYDDTLLLNLGTTVLISSHNNVIPDFDKDGELVVYNWDKIKGKSGFFDDTPAYCLGGSTCQLPLHDKTGPVNISLDGKAFSELGLKLLKNGRFPDFEMIATGDNDPEDCFHADITFDMEVKYFVP